MKKMLKILFYSFLIIFLGCFIFLIIGKDKAQRDRIEVKKECVESCQKNIDKFRREDMLGVFYEDDYDFCSEFVCQPIGLIRCVNNWPFKVWPYSKLSAINDFFCRLYK